MMKYLKMRLRSIIVQQKGVYGTCEPRVYGLTSAAAAAASK